MSIKVIHFRYEEWEKQQKAFKEQCKGRMFEPIYEESYGSGYMPFDEFIKIFSRNRTMARIDEVRTELSKVQGVPEDYSKIDCFRLGFFEAVKWADRTMLDKVCEWLKENIDLYAAERISIKSGYPEIVLTDYFEKNFRQAMGGGRNEN